MAEGNIGMIQSLLMFVGNLCGTLWQPALFFQKEIVYVFL